MSGAEASLVAIGLASNILQFIDFTSKICSRIKEISSTSSGLPRELDKQASQLSLVLGLLREAEQCKGLDVGKDVLASCQSQAKELDALLKSFEGGSSNGRLNNAKLAFRSLRQKEDIAKVGKRHPRSRRCKVSFVSSPWRIPFSAPRGRLVLAPEDSALHTLTYPERTLGVGSGIGSPGSLP